MEATSLLGGIMTAVLLIFLLALGLAVTLGWSADTRDSADWKEHADRDRGPTCG